MSRTYRVPRVRSNQRVVPKDFNRLVEAVLDAPAMILRHVLLPSTLTGGVVLYGLRVSNAADGANPRRVRISAGACVMPDTAANIHGTAENDATLDSAGHRIVIVPNDILVDLDELPAARTDTIHIELNEQEEVTESREFRVVGGGGQSVENQNVTTYRRPFGAGYVNKSTNGTTVAGKVRLATVEIAADSTLGAITDYRSLMWPVTSGTDPDASGGVGAGYARDLSELIDWMRSRLESVVDVDYLGGLKSAILVAAGGNTILTDATSIDFVDRIVKGIATWQAGRLRLGKADVADPDFDPEHYENYIDGLALNAGTVTRGIAIITTKYDGGVYNGFFWGGQRVTDCQRVAQGIYDVTFNGAVTESTVGAMKDSRRWSIECHALPHNSDTTGALLDTQLYRPKSVVPQHMGTNTIRVRLWAWDPDALGNTGIATGAWAAEDFPFSVAIRGPVTPEAGDLTEV